MKKILVGIVGIVLILLAVACVPPTAQPADQATEGDQVSADTAAPAADTTVADLEAAFSGAQPFKCTALLEGREFTFWQKGDKQRSEVIVEQLDSKVISVFEAKIVHSWDPVKKEGFTMDLEKIAQMAKDMDLEQDVPEEPFSAKTMKEEMPDIACVYTDVPDSMFTVPSDVAFEDMTKMMEQLMEMAKEYEDNQ